MTDPLMDHLEMMSGMHDSHYSTRQYAITESQEREAEDRLRDDVREEGRRIELGNVREAYLRGFYFGEPGLEANEQEPG